MTGPGAERTALFERFCRPEPGRTARLVVDMQRGFLEPGAALEVPAARDAVPRVRLLLDGFRRKGLPVAFTEFEYSPAVPLLVGDVHPEHRPAVRATRSASEDAVATLWPEIRHATLDIIRRAYGRVASAKETADVVEAW